MQWTRRRLLQARLSKHASRKYIQMLRLLETFGRAEVTHAVEDASRLDASASTPRAILLCRIEPPPPRLDLANSGHLPKATVSTTLAGDYMVPLTCQPATLLLVTLRSHDEHPAGDTYAR